MSRLKSIMLFVFCLMFLQISGQESVNDEINSIIKKHGMEQSEVMEIASWLCDVYGPRLTGSPMLDKATEHGS